MHLSKERERPLSPSKRRASSFREFLKATENAALHPLRATRGCCLSWDSAGTVSGNVLFSLPPATKQEALAKGGQLASRQTHSTLRHSSPSPTDEVGPNSAALLISCLCFATEAILQLSRETLPVCYQRLFLINAFFLLGLDWNNITGSYLSF